MQTWGKTSKQKDGFIHCCSFSSSVTNFSMLSTPTDQSIAELQNPGQGAQAPLRVSVLSFPGGNKVTRSPVTCFRSQRLLAPITFLYRKFYVKWFSCSVSSKVPLCVSYLRTYHVPHLQELNTIVSKKMRSPGTDKFHMANTVCTNSHQTC